MARSRLQPSSSHTSSVPTAHSASRESSMENTTQPSHHHSTPRMHQRPGDPAYVLLDGGHTSVQVVHRKGCYICEDREFARMGLPLCKRCCQCAAKGKDGHMPADSYVCDDCQHDMCEACLELPPQEAEICTCDTPCCEADVGVGIMTCGEQHCPTHGLPEGQPPGWK